jgi:ATP-binding protein involved in chromosome partitioning
VPLIEADADDPASQAIRHAARGLIALMPMQPVELPVMQEPEPVAPAAPVGMSLPMA